MYRLTARERYDAIYANITIIAFRFDEFRAKVAI